jgi:uncharacterized membrane protein
VNIDKVIAGIFSLIVSVWFFKYRSGILYHLAKLHKQHHQEELSQELIVIVRIFVAAFFISALVASIILLYQGASSNY